MVFPFLLTIRQLAMMLPFSSSQILTGLVSLVPGKFPLALFSAKPREHLAVMTLSSCMRKTLISLVIILGQYRSHENRLLIFVHLEFWQLKKPLSFILSFSLSITIPSALWWQSINSLMFAQCPKLQLNTPESVLHSLPLLQLYFFRFSVFTWKTDKEDKLDSFQSIRCDRSTIKKGERERVREKEI